MVAFPKANNAAFVMDSQQKAWKSWKEVGGNTNTHPKVQTLRWSRCLGMWRRWHFFLRGLKLGIILPFEMTYKG